MIKNLNRARAQRNARRDEQLRRDRLALIEQIDEACSFARRCTTLDESQVLAALTIVTARRNARDAEEFARRRWPHLKEDP